MRASSVRAAFLLAAASAAIAACNAIVGVEDVRLAPGLDAATPDAEVDAPAPFVDDGGGDDADAARVALALGFNHSCALRPAGTVACWGDDSVGQLGDGVSLEAGAAPPSLVARAVQGLDDAIAIASGVSHSCAARRGGSVVCWGYNYFGQLGDGTTTKSSLPVTVSGVSGATSVAAGTSFSCARLGDGGVACWGANYGGQLGDGTKTDRPTAAPVTGVSKAVAVAAAERHACALLEGGAVVCWGGNDDGQLGNGSTTESLSPTPVALSGVAQIAAAAKFTCARKTGGAVYCWGANTHGELGTGAVNDTPNPSPVLTAVSDAVDLWVGYEHGCAVRRSGEVVCWGAAGEGQVGTGTVPADASIPNPTRVVGVSSVVGVSTGGTHSCASTAGEAVYCWGTNTLGQLGNGTTQRAYAAVPVTGFP